MDKADRKEYKKAYDRAYYQAHKEESKARFRAYNQAHRDEQKAYQKDYKKSHRDEQKAYQKAYYQAHREELKDYNRSYQKAYRKSDTNSLGKTKNSVRCKSRKYLFNTLRHTKVEGYEIHHCFGYDDYRHFIYIPKELHLQIHQYLRDSNISADSNHYVQIEHIIINYYKHNDKHFLVL